MSSPEPWTAFAACLDMAPKQHGDPDPWFPERGQAAIANRGRHICFSCKVKKQCADYQERTASDYGMWNGEIVKRPNR